MNVVLIAGKKRNGKDTHANALQEVLVAEGEVVCIEHFADPIKGILIDAGFVTGLPENKEEERIHFQKFGNEVMKKWFGDNVWASAMENILRNRLKDGYDTVIIPDFRYPVEFETLGDQLCYEITTFRVRRRNYMNDSDKHSSENALHGFDFDKEFSARDLDEVSDNAEMMAEQIA